MQAKFQHVSITAYQLDMHRYGSTWLHGFSWLWD